MVLIGAWLLLTNTMGIKTTDFVSLPMNSGNRMQMFSLGGGRSGYTWEEIKVKFILNCLFSECKNQRSRDAHDIMATSVLKFISKISDWSYLYTTAVFCGRLGWSVTTVFDEFIWAFRNRRHKDCLSVVQDVLFQRLLPGATGVPLPKMRDCTKRMIAILEHEMMASKDRWPGHPSIPPRVFGSSQYLMTPPTQLTKPKPKPKLMVTSKPLPADAPSKLVSPETWSDAKEWWHKQAIAGGDVIRVVGTSATLINNFMHWVWAISANMNPKEQLRALVASRKAASSVFTDAGDHETSSIAVKTTLALRDVRKVEYSAELAVVGFPPQNRDGRHSSENWQLKLNKLQSASVWSDLKLPSPKHTRSHSWSRKDDCQKVNEEKRDAWPDKRD